MQHSARAGAAHCREKEFFLLLTAGRGSTPGAFPAVFWHVVAETAPALRGNIVTVQTTGKILGPAKTRLAVCSAAQPSLSRTPCAQFQCPIPWENARVATMMPNLRHARAANPTPASCALTGAVPIPGARYQDAPCAPMNGRNVRNACISCARLAAARPVRHAAAGRHVRRQLSEARGLRARNAHGRRGVRQSFLTRHCAGNATA